MKNEKLEAKIRYQKIKNRELQKEGLPPQTYNLVNSDEEVELATYFADGEQFTECQKCGTVFEQDFVAELSRYHNYKTCPKCRNKKSTEKTRKKPIEHVMNVSTVKYSPYPWQKKFHADMQRISNAVLCCGSRCVTENNFVSGVNKLAKDLKIKDNIISKDGKIQKILDIKTDVYNDYVYTLKPIGMLPLECTADHGIMVAKISKNNDSARNNEVKKQFISEDFYTMQEIETFNFKYPKHGRHDRYFVKIPRIKGKLNIDKWECEKFKSNIKNQIDYLPLNEETAWLYGAYCADGCALGGKTFQITCNSDNTERIQQITRVLNNLNIYNKQFQVEGTKTYQIRAFKVQFAETLSKYIGVGSANKKIPIDILYHENDNILKEFMIGYYGGDGYYNKKIGALTCSTVSKGLAIDLQLAWARFGFFAPLSSFKRDRVKYKKDGTPTYDKEIYTLVTKNKQALEFMGYQYEGKKIDGFAFVTEDAVYSEIKSIKKEFKETQIYSIATKDESLLINGFVNHNCGKNRAVNMQFIQDFACMLNENRHIDRPDLVPSIHCWFVAPVEKLALQNWRELKAFFPKDWIVAISESTFTIQTIGGGIIEVRSAHDPETLVSVALDWCNITEGARVKRLLEVASNIEDRLNSPDRGVIMPDGKKRSRFIIDSSPLGKNEFYQMWQWGQKNSQFYDSNWVSYQNPSSANPSIAKKYAEMVETKNGDYHLTSKGQYIKVGDTYIENGKEIVCEYGKYITYEESLRRRKGKKFLQDNLAQFLDSGGTVFPEFESKCIFDIHRGNERVPLGEQKQFIKKWQEVIPGERYRLGYDPASGSSKDLPAIVVRQLSNNRIVRGINLYGKVGDAQLDAVAYWARYYNNAEVCVLKLGAIHADEQLKGRGLLVTTLSEQGLGKRGLVESLQSAVSNGDVTVLDDGSEANDMLIFQMKDYTQNEKTGKFSNQTEANDDFVSALYACYHDYLKVILATKHYTGHVHGSATSVRNKRYAQRSTGYRRR